MAESYKIEAVLSLVDNMSGALQSAGQAVQSFGDNVQSKLNGVGKAMTVAGAATTAMGMKSLKSFGEFQQSLNTAAVVAGGTAKDINGLADVANKMGADLPLSAQDASDAMVEMARNGANVGQIKEQFPAIAQAATAAGADLQMTAGVVQQAMNIWGSSIKSPAQAAEILVQTANLSNASIEDMQQGLANVGGTANMAGMSLQDTSEAIGLLTNHGFSAAQASQDLNHAILQMLAPSKTAKATMDELGISFVDAQGKMKSFPQILEDLNNAMAKLNPDQKAKALKSMFGTAGMEAIGPLMDAMANKTGNAAQSWDAWSKAVDKAAGTSKSATKSLSTQASEMQKNVGAQIEQLGGNWEALRNSAMSSSSRVNGAILGMMNSTLEWANSSHSGIAKVIRDFVGLSPVIGPVTTAIGGFVTNAGKIVNVAGSAVKGLGSMTKWFGSLLQKILPIGNAGNKASAGLNETAVDSSKAGKSASESSNGLLQLGLAILEIGAGVGLATAGMAALVFATAQLAKQGLAGVGTLMAVTVALSALITVLTVAAKSLGTIGPSTALAFAGMALLIASFALLTAAITAFASTGTQGLVALLAISAAITVLTAVMAALAPTLTAGAVGLVAFGAAVLMIGVGIGMATAGIAMLISAFNNLNTSAATIIATMTALGQGFAMMLTTFITTLATQIPIIAQSIMQMIIGIMAAFNTALPQMITIGTQIIVNLLNGIAIALPQIMLAATNVIVAFVEGIAANLGQIITAALDLLQAFVDGIGQNMSRIIDIAMEAVMQFVYGVGYALGRISSSGTQLISTFVSGIIAGFSKSTSAGKGASNAAINGVKSMVSGMIGAGQNLVMGLVNGIKSGLKWVVDAAKSVAEAAVNAAKSALKIHSPSRVMRDEVGYFVSAGMAKGILNNVGLVSDAVNTLSQAAVIDIPAANANHFNASLNSINARMNDLGMSVDGTLSANNIIDNTSSRNFEARMEMMMQETIKKLNNVDQTPVVTVDTLNRMRDYNEKTGAQAYVMLKGGR